MPMLRVKLLLLVQLVLMLRLQFVLLQLILVRPKRQVSVLQKRRVTVVRILQMQQVSVGGAGVADATGVGDVDCIAAIGIVIGTGGIEDVTINGDGIGMLIGLALSSASRTILNEDD
jgi:hypothetical protein